MFKLFFILYWRKLNSSIHSARGSKNWARVQGIQPNGDNSNMANEKQDLDEKIFGSLVEFGKFSLKRGGVDRES